MVMRILLECSCFVELIGLPRSVVRSTLGVFKVDISAAEVCARAISS